MVSVKSNCQLYREDDSQNGMESRWAGKAQNAEEIGYVVALIMGWTEYAAGCVFLIFLFTWIDSEIF